MKYLRLWCLIFLCSLAVRAQSTPPSSLPSSPASSPAVKEESTPASSSAPTPAAAPPPSVQEKSANGDYAASLTEKKKPVHVRRFERPPVIDGQLDEEMWKDAATLKDFYQTQPGDNIAPSRQTEVLIGYDTQFLYLGFKAHDAPEKVRATVAKRDNVLNDDNVRVYLDTFNDQRKAYVFVFNALGVQQDGILTEGSTEDYSVDVVMESKGMLNAEGYTVEVSIPFKSLRYEAGQNKNWGIHVYRRIKHLNDEQNSWMPVSRSNSSFLGQAGFITGLEGISTERTLELIPSLAFSESGSRVRGLTPPPLALANPLAPDAGRFVNRPISVDPGLTAKLGITPTVTLDLTINPDFAQVEADQLVVTANQRFPIFFEEKRPFFLEGIDIFQTLLQPVHTRVIVDPDVAAKLSGKRGRNTFGLMMAVDRAPGNFSEEERTDPRIFPAIERFIDKKAHIGIVRLKRDIGKENYLGFIGTSYNFIEKHNQLAGFDGRFRLDAQKTFSFQVLGTTSRRFFYDADADADVYRTGNGFAYFLVYENNGRNFGYKLDAQGRTADYVADVGFTRRVDTNLYRAFLYYNSEQNGQAKLISWRMTTFAELRFDWQGRSQFVNDNSELRFNLQRQSYILFGFQKGYERLFEEEFGARRRAGRQGAFAGDDAERSAYRKNFYVLGGTTPNKKYSFTGIIDYYWGVLDFDFGSPPKFSRVSPAALLDPGAPYDPGPGNELIFDATFTYQPTQALRAEFRYLKDRLTRLDTGRTAFDANIFGLRSTYQFTRFSFARVRLDYDTLNTSLRGQFLFGWTPNPGTSLYMGYNNDVNHNGFNPFTREPERGFRRNGQTFFIKMSYLFRRSL